MSCLEYSHPHTPKFNVGGISTRWPLAKSGFYFASSRVHSKALSEADFGNFPNHSKKNAQPFLAKSWAESTPQNSKRSHGVKNTFFVRFHANIKSLMLGHFLGSGLILVSIFRENVSKPLCFTRFESRRGTRKRIQTIRTIKTMNRKWYMTGSSDPRFLARLRPGWR